MQTRILLDMYNVLRDGGPSICDVHPGFIMSRCDFFDASCADDSNLQVVSCLRRSLAHHLHIEAAVVAACAVVPKHSSQARL